MAETLILTDLAKSYPGALLPILRGISLTVLPAERVAILGPSGSGKSTLLNIIGSLDAPTSGSVRLGEIVITALTGSALQRFRSHTVGFIFQDHHLLPQLTAVENVLLPSLAAGVPAKMDDARALLARVGITERLEAYPAQLSGGERQRVAIARALINGPQLLLCDEPTGNLDRANGDAVMTLLFELSAQQQVTVIMVTHNQEYAARCQRQYEIVDGQLTTVTECVR